MIDLVREGVDCVVRIGGLSDSTLIARSLPAGAAPGHPRWRRLRGLPRPADQPRRVAKAPLHRLPLGHHRAAGATGVRRRRPHRDNLPASFVVNHGEAYVAACGAGLGIVQVPRYHVERQLAADSLVELLPQHPPPALPMTVLHPHRRRLTPRSQGFID
ncbi:LysR substrate-binding domain-containing protein [Azorhizophilus paspali]